MTAPAGGTAGPDRTLAGQVALVTGGARRVGRAIAVGLAREGMRIAIHYHGDDAAAADAAAEIAAAGGVPELFRADLRAPTAPDTLMRQVVERFGGIDLLVNSAAIMERTPLGQISVEQWDAIMSLNLRAPFFLAQAAGVAMGARGGTVINLADLAAFETWPAFIPHGISKAGIVFMTRALARALAPAVRVCAVAPGAVLLPEHWSAEDAEHLVRTTPLGRLGSPDDVVQAVLYLAKADYVTGETIIVDGGRHVRG